VVLSACETGKGKLIQGEGMLSLSRAFSYAGCQSIITSLWKADDQATAYIATRLHFYLSRGLDKDIALQKSKIDYLNDKEIEQRFKLPLYWANMVLVGDPSPVWQKPNISLVYLFGAGIFLAAGIIWLLKRHLNKIKNA
jgi:CHAT domain-containing protein